MELSKAVTECVVQGHMMRLGAGRKEETLYVEYLFYGLLMLANCEKPPISNAGFKAAGDEIKATLSLRISSLEAAAETLRQAAQGTAGAFVIAEPYLQRAADIAAVNGKSEIDPASLFNAIMQKTTPVIEGVLDRRLEPNLQGVVNPTPGPKPPAPPPVPPPAVPGPQEAGNPPEELTVSQIVRFMDMMVAMQGGKQRPLKPGSNERQRPGGRGAARGQVKGTLIYLIFTAIVPFAIFYLINQFTGFIASPQTPMMIFVRNALLLTWCMMLMMGVNRLVSMRLKGFGQFLSIMTWCALTAGIFLSYGYAFGEVDIWRRIVLHLLLLFQLITGRAAFMRVEDTGEVFTTGMLFQNLTSTRGIAIWRHLTTQLIPPLLVFAVFHIFELTAPLWLEKTLYIIGFLYAWGTSQMLWHIAAVKSPLAQKRKVFPAVIEIQHTMLLLPALALYLHWLFAWFPMQTWVIVVLGIYGVIWLLLTITITMMIKKGDL